MLFLSSCKSLTPGSDSFIPKNLSAEKAGLISGAMHIQHQNLFKTVLFDISVSEDALRIDLTAVLDIPLLTALINSKGNSAVLVFPSKQYYRGPQPKKLIRHTVSKDLSFGFLRNILLDRRPAEKSWKCGYDKQKLPIQCHNKNHFIKWNRGIKRSLLLKTGNSYLKLYYKQFKPFVKSSLFEPLSIPKNFKPLPVQLSRD